MARTSDSDKPGIVSSILAMLAGIVLGVFIAIIALVIKPVSVTNSPTRGATGAKSAETPLISFNDVSVVRGKLGVPISGQSSARQRAFIEKNPAGVELIEEDVNRWLSATYGSKGLAFSFDAEKQTFVPKVPTVRVDGDEIELLSETEVGKGKDAFDFVMHARGTLEMSDGHVVFVPHSMHFGSCPVFGFAQPYMLKLGMSLLAVPENVSGAWDAVRGAKVEEGRLKFAFN